MELESVFSFAINRDGDFIGSSSADAAIRVGMDVVVANDQDSIRRGEVDENAAFVFEGVAEQYGALLATIEANHADSVSEAVLQSVSLCSCDEPNTGLPSAIRARLRHGSRLVVIVFGCAAGLIGSDWRRSVAIAHWQRKQTGEIVPGPIIWAQIPPMRRVDEVCVKAEWYVGFTAGRAGTPNSIGGLTLHITATWDRRHAATCEPARVGDRQTSVGTSSAAAIASGFAARMPSTVGSRWVARSAATMRAPLREA